MALRPAGRQPHHRSHRLRRDDQPGPRAATCSRCRASSRSTAIRSPTRGRAGGLAHRRSGPIRTRRRGVARAELRARRVARPLAGSVRGNPAAKAPTLPTTSPKAVPQGAAFGVPGPSRARAGPPGRLPNGRGAMTGASASARASSTRIRVSSTVPSVDSDPVARRASAAPPGRPGPPSAARCPRRWHPGRRAAALGRPASQVTSQTSSQIAARPPSTSLIASSTTNGAIAASSPSSSCSHAAPHLGVHDRLQVGERGRVGEHDARQRGPVQRPRRRPRRRSPNRARMAGERRLPGRGRVARHRVGIDDEPAQASEHPRDRRLAAADGPGQPDEERPLRSPRIRPSRRSHRGARSDSASQASSAWASAAIDVGQLARQAAQLHEVGLHARVAERQLQLRLAQPEPGQVVLDTPHLPLVGILGQRRRWRARRPTAVPFVPVAAARCRWSPRPGRALPSARRPLGARRRAGPARPRPSSPPRPRPARPVAALEGRGLARRVAHAGLDDPQPLAHRLQQPPVVGHDEHRGG